MGTSSSIYPDLLYLILLIILSSWKDTSKCPSMQKKRFKGSWKRAAKTEDRLRRGKNGGTGWKGQSLFLISSRDESLSKVVLDWLMLGLDSFAR
jgi:hypothetical protein